MIIFVDMHIEHQGILTNSVSRAYLDSVIVEFLVVAASANLHKVHKGINHLHSRHAGQCRQCLDIVFPTEGLHP